ALLALGGPPPRGPAGGRDAGRAPAARAAGLGARGDRGVVRGLRRDRPLAPQAGPPRVADRSGARAGVDSAPGAGRRGPDAGGAAASRPGARRGRTGWSGSLTGSGLTTSPTGRGHVRRPRLDYESRAAGLDRNELGALLVAAGLGLASEHALISLLTLNGLRVS